MVSAICWFVEYARAGLLWDTPELAAAGFSGLVTFRGRGGIDGGNDRLCDADFGGGDFGGPIGSGGFGTHGGNGGCDVSVLRSGEVGGTSSASSLSDNWSRSFSVLPLGAGLHVLQICTSSILYVAFQAFIPYFGLDVRQSSSF